MAASGMFGSLYRIKITLSHVKMSKKLLSNYIQKAPEIEK